MMNFINSIPDSIGWALVGGLFVLCAIMAVKVTKMFVQMWREHHEEEERN